MYFNIQTKLSLPLRELFSLFYTAGLICSQIRARKQTSPGHNFPRSSHLKIRLLKKVDRAKGVIMHMTFLGKLLLLVLGS